MKKIVLIEDDADLFALIKYNLEKEGFSFAGSQTGKGAIDLCRRERLPIRVFDFFRKGALADAVLKGTGGTLITDEKRR